MAKKLILIVDDNVDARFVFTALLNHDGYRVVEAEDGLRGVELALSLAPDLILMDIHMPGMDGFQATACIRAAGQVPRPLILSLTAHSLTRAEGVMATKLFDGNFEKPIAPRDVLTEVQRRIGAP